MIVVEDCPVRPSFAGNEWPSLCELNLDQRPWGYEAKQDLLQAGAESRQQNKKRVLMF